MSQPKPSKGDLANHAAVSTLNPSTGVVTPLLTTLQSPKGLLFVPAAATAGAPTSGASTPSPTTPAPGGVTPPAAVDSGRADPGTPNAALITTGAALLGLAAFAGVITSRRRSPGQ